MAENKYCVYLHTSPSGKYYVGITCQEPARRWRRGEGYKDSPIFYNAIARYGWDNFKHDILIRGLSYSEAERLERFYIKLLNSNARENGYNIESGGGSGKRLTDATKKKLSEANKSKGNPQALDDWRKNGGTPWNKGTRGATTHNEEWRAKMSEMMSGDKNPAHGKDYSHLRKTPYSETVKRGKEHHNSKSIEQYDLLGNYIKTFDCVADVARELGKRTSSEIRNVVKCANGERRTAYGFIWKFKEEVS